MKAMYGCWFGKASRPKDWLREAIQSDGSIDRAVEAGLRCESRHFIYRILVAALRPDRLVLLPHGQRTARDLVRKVPR